MDYYKDAIKKYIVFEGRASRKEFWMFVLISLIITILLSIIDSIIGTSGMGSGGLLANLYTLAVFLPSLAIGVRRLHDTGRSGWWMLIGLIPFIGTIVLIVFWAQGGKSTSDATAQPSINA